MASEVKHVPIPPRGVDYRGKVVLAPMVRSGELPSRLLALRYGADLVWGPETVDRAMIGTTRKFNEVSQTVDWVRRSSHSSGDGGSKESVIYRVLPKLETGKLVFQLGTSDPDRAVEAAKLVAADVAGIDVNAGCPKPFSTTGGMGAALLRVPDTLCAILEALVKSIIPEYQIGVSVKIRILETPEQTEALVRRLVQTGITGLTVHCRTPDMRKHQRAIREQLRMVVSICHEAGVSCTMNGDVANRAQGQKLADEFGADGAMIALAAEENPSCFRSEADGGMLPWREVVEDYLKTAMGVHNRLANTKYLLSQMVPGKTPFYSPMSQSRTYVDICKALEFPEMMDGAQKLDIYLGLGVVKVKPPKPPKQQNRQNQRKEKRRTSDRASPEVTQGISPKRAKPTPAIGAQAQAVASST